MTIHGTPGRNDWKASLSTTKPVMMRVFAMTFGKLSKCGYIRMYPSKDEVTEYKWRAQARLRKEIGEVLSIKDPKEVLRRYSISRELLTAFTAGFIDAEGSIHIVITKRKRVRGGKVIRVTFIEPRLAMYSTDREILEEIRKAWAKYGIYFHIRICGRATPNSKSKIKKPPITWKMGLQKISALKRLLPELLRYMKHEERIEKAKLALDILHGRIPKDAKLIRELLERIKKEYKEERD
ncbi:MAG TPA: hypothetical protein ENF75_03175, partial [Acidilobales archaeon]|nr:hypothetical protein [Acidilobales archaeon]